MVKILLHGCNGKMGRMITEIVKSDENTEIVAGVDTYMEIPNDYPVYGSIEKCDADADVAVDFSNAGAVDTLLDYCVERGLPWCCARQGFLRGSFRRSLRHPRKQLS